MGQQKKLFLLDAMALIYRAYFAFSKNPRINSKGMNTSAIFGFANSLYDIIKNEKPSHLGVAFDTHAPTLRHDDFTEYKANREQMPEDLAASIPYIKELLDGFNIPVLFVDGYEADDVIGTLAKEAEKEGFQTFMMTPDKDFGQLVSENIFMYKPAKFGNKAEVWGVKEVCTRYGIKRPEQLIDILGLWGDASDNIPGVPGIGEKRAIELIQQFDSIDNVLKNTDKLKGKMKENLEEFAGQARQSRDLATIILNVPIVFNEKDLELNEPNPEALKKLFDELEFRQFAQRVFTDLSLNNEDKPEIAQPELFGENEIEITVKPEPSGMATIQDNQHQYHLVETEEKAKALAKLLSAQKEFCFDTETTGLDANDSELVGMSFAFKPGEAWYVPVSANYHEAQKMTNIFKAVFENKKINKIGQNIKFDMSILKWYDITVAGKIFDTMIAHYLLQPDQRHGMDYLSETYLGYKPVSIETLIGKKGKNQLSMRAVDLEIIKEYA
ncbi:MAG TPA: 5'-3' exonuclease H3TH domain-containing protein, partial [Bacteroidales bacterium]